MELSNLILFLYFKKELSKLKKKKKNKKPTLKGFLIFWEMELSSPNIKKVFLYLSKELAKLKTKNFV